MNSKYIVLALTALLAIGGCTKKVKLDTDTQKGSYAVGHQIGSNMKQQGIELDSDALSGGIVDALKGDKSKLTPEDTQKALMALQKASSDKQAALSEKNKNEGKAFLEKTKADMKVTASGLQYKVLTEGTGPMPKDTDTVVAHYKGTLTNGEKFDSSYDRGQPAEFPVKGVIPGWTEALKMMKVGSKWLLHIPPELGYGPNPRPGIPGNSVLIFEVELVKIK